MCAGDLNSGLHAWATSTLLNKLFPQPWVSLIRKHLYFLCAKHFSIQASFFSCVLFETRSHDVALIGLECTEIHLPRLPDYLCPTMPGSCLFACFFICLLSSSHPSFAESWTQRFKDFEGLNHSPNLHIFFSFNLHKNHLQQWLLTFLMLRCFNTVPHAAVTPKHKVIPLLLRNYTATTGGDPLVYTDETSDLIYTHS